MSRARSSIIKEKRASCRLSGQKGQKWSSGGERFLSIFSVQRSLKISCYQLESQTTGNRKEFESRFWQTFVKLFCKKLARVYDTWIHSPLLEITGPRRGSEKEIVSSTTLMMIIAGALFSKSALPTATPHHLHEHLPHYLPKHNQEHFTQHLPQHLPKLLLQRM